MTDLRKATEYALEALEQARDELNTGNEYECRQILNAQIKYLRQALAQPEQTRIYVCVESIKPHPIKGWEIT